VQILGIDKFWALMSGNGYQGRHRGNDDGRTGQRAARRRYAAPGDAEAVGEVRSSPCAEHIAGRVRSAWVFHAPSSMASRAPLRMSTSPSSACRSPSTSARQPAQTFYMANDADVAGMAEMRFGAGKGNDGVVLIITIGTGLGTALFSDGHLMPNTELGHVFLSQRRRGRTLRVGSRAHHQGSQVEGLGRAPQSLPDDHGKPALAGPDRARRRRQREAAQVLADDHHQGAGRRRQLPEPGRHRRCRAVC
jgi:hypothetical protein